MTSYCKFGADAEQWLVEATGTCGALVEEVTPQTHQQHTHFSLYKLVRQHSTLSQHHL